MTSEDDVKYMRLAIEASREALRIGNNAFGATLVDRTGKLVHVAGNNQVTSNDCTGHAEVAAVREAVAKFGADVVVGSTVYASGEPCAMCSAAMFWGGVAKIVFAAPNQTINKILGAPSLSITSREVLKSASRPVEIVGPFLAEEAAEVLREMAKVKGRGPK
jgi:tRNA(Arg) A34 adenosine deaminase TadA